MSNHGSGIVSETLSVTGESQPLLVSDDETHLYFRGRVYQDESDPPRDPRSLSERITAALMTDDWVIVSKGGYGVVDAEELDEKQAGT